MGVFSDFRLPPKTVPKGLVLAEKRFLANENTAIFAGKIINLCPTAARTVGAGMGTTLNIASYLVYA